MKLSRFIYPTSLLVVVFISVCFIYLEKNEETDIFGMPNYEFITPCLPMLLVSSASAIIGAWIESKNLPAERMKISGLFSLSICGILLFFIVTRMNVHGLMPPLIVPFLAILISGTILLRKSKYSQ